MLRLSVIFSVLHFCLAYGLRNGFVRTGELNAKAASEISCFAERIEFFLTQPGRSLCDCCGCAEGSVEFWALMIFTSVLWGNILALVVKFFLKTLFR